jgi:HAD superfamily hydrolase (TIGR01509 family)
MRELRGFQGPMTNLPSQELVPGIAEALEQISERLVCCVATNARTSGAALVGVALSRTGVRHHFKHIFASKDMGMEKPAPGFFENVLQTVGVAPHECVMVGDDYRIDIVGAKNAGMQTIWFSEALQETPAPCADIVINSMVDLVSAVKALEGTGTP